MEIFSQTFKNFSDAAERLRRISVAINTPLIPYGGNVTEFVNSYLGINLNRKFAEGYSREDSILSLDENKLFYRFVSMSSTCVDVRAAFDHKMEVREVKIIVDLPNERVASGRRDYEHLTADLYAVNFINKCQIDVVIHDGKMLPTPEWAVRKVEDLLVTEDSVNKHLVSLGFVEWEFLPCAWVKGDLIALLDPRSLLLSIGTEYDPITFSTRLADVEKRIERIVRRDIPSEKYTDFEEYVDYTEEDFEDSEEEAGKNA